MENKLVDKLKEKNLRVTNARKAIYKVLSESEKSLSVQCVYQMIKETPGVKTDKVSVYRNLSLFSEMGLVHRFQDGKYTTCSHSSEHHDHDHQHLHILANCQKCGTTVEVDAHEPGLCDATNRLKSYVQAFSSFNGVTLDGICADCTN